MTGAFQKRLHRSAVRRRFEIHVRGQLVGQPADFAPAHGVGLAGERERAHARAADAAGEQVAVDDGVDLVGAAGGLVDALGVTRVTVRSVRANQFDKTACTCFVPRPQSLGHGGRSRARWHARPPAPRSTPSVHAWRRKAY